MSNEKKKMSTRYVINSMDPYCEANSQEISHLLWDPKVTYRLHKSPSLVPTLIQMNPVHISHTLIEIHFSIALRSTSRSSKWSLSFTVVRQKFCKHFSSLKKKLFVSIILGFDQETCQQSTWRMWEGWGTKEGEIEDKRKRNNCEAARLWWRLQMVMCAQINKQPVISSPH
jgi:hypothetical protein